MILWISAAIVAFFTWGLSPIKPLFVLFVFAFILVAILNSRKSYPERFRFDLSWWVVFVVAVMRTATIHDIMITSYASALCCDGTYQPLRAQTWNLLVGITGSAHGGHKLPPWWKRSETSERRSLR